MIFPWCFLFFIFFSGACFFGGQDVLDEFCVVTVRGSWKDVTSKKRGLWNYNHEAHEDETHESPVIPVSTSLYSHQCLSCNNLIHTSTCLKKIPPTLMKSWSHDPHATPCFNTLPPRYMLSLSPTWMLQEPMQLNQLVPFLRPVPRPPRFQAPKLREKSQWGRKQFNPCLVAGFSTNPSEKIGSQIGNLPQIGMKVKNNWNHHLVMILLMVQKSIEHHLWCGKPCI